MMFLRSVGAVFRGVSSYPEFSKRNPFRALLHLLLFCFLLSLICSGIQLYSIGKNLDICAAGIAKQMGSLQVSEQGMFPEKGSDESFTFLLPGNLRLDYITPENLSQVREMGSWKQSMGIIWVRCGFLIWMRPDSSRELWYMGNLPIPDMNQAVKLMPKPQMMLKPVDLQNIETVLREYQAKPELEFGKPKTEKYEFAAISQSLKKYIYASLILRSWLDNFFLTLVLILMFAGMQSLWRAPGLEQLKFGGTVSLLSYAAFPAVSAQMILESFSFYLLAEILFFVLFFIYQLMAFNEVRRAVSGERPPDAGC